MHSVAKFQKVEEGTISRQKDFWEKSHKAEKRRKSHSVKKWKRGTLLIWNFSLKEKRRLKTRTSKALIKTVISKIACFAQVVLLPIQSLRRKTLHFLCGSKLSCLSSGILGQAL